MSYVTIADGEVELHPLDQDQINYLEDRGLDLEMAVRMGVQNASLHGSKCIAFPFYKNEKIVNIKFKTLDKKFFQSKGGEKVFYNHQVLTDPTLKDLPLVICEGELDCLVALQAGFSKSVSVPDGAPSKSIEVDRDQVSNKYDYLREALSLIDDCKEVILCTDGDSSGQVLRDDLAMRLGKARCKWVTYPEGCKDLNDVLKKFGNDGVKNVIRKSKWYEVDGVFRFSELPPIETKPIYELGMGTFDDHYKLRRGDFSVITGLPSSGKSTFVNHMMSQLAKNHGLKISFASFEQKPQTDHLRALRKWYLFEYENTINDWSDVSEDKKSRCAAWLDKHFNVIVPSFDDNVNLQWLIERMQVSVIQHDCDVIIIDPFNEMDHETGHNEPMRLYIGWFIKTLKRFCSKHDVHVIVVAHPRKIGKDQDGNIEIPTLYDIEESSMWYNKADLGLIVHRKDGITLARVAKSRYEDMIGKRGQVLFTFDSSTSHYMELRDNAI